MIVHEVQKSCSEIREGILECTKCHNLWTIVDGIPRFISPGSCDLEKDYEFAARNKDTLNAIEVELHQRLLEKLKSISGLSDHEDYYWNREEMIFWETEYERRLRYDDENAMTYNRIIPRNDYVITPLREAEICTVLEIGCGTCGTLHKLNDFLSGKTLVGTDLSFNALRAARKFVSGNFVMCEATKLPFKPGMFDLLLSFGVLHHLEMRQDALETLYQKVKEGGYLAFTEKLKSSIDFKKYKFLNWIKRLFGPKRHRSEEGDHEEYIDPIEALRICRKHGDVIVSRYEYSAIRVLLMKLIVEKLGLTGKSVTRLIIRLDLFMIDYFGRFGPLFEGTGLIATTQKSVDKNINDDV